MALSEKNGEFPSVSIIIPTYNEEKIIGECLGAIFKQDYPKKLLQVIVIDGRSKDRTVEISRSLGAEVIETDLPYEELKRVEAIRKYAKNDIVGLFDADNIVPDEVNWLKRMLAPFKDPEISAADSLYYVYRDKENFISKYGALIGGDDPVAFYLGLNDRWCYFQNFWSKIPHQEIDRGDYLEVTLDKARTPAAGANGYFFRRKLFEKAAVEVFLHPIFVHRLVNSGYPKMAKVKVGIIHAQRGTLSVFFKRKTKRVKRRFEGELKWDYNYGLKKRDLIKTAFYIGSIVLPIKDMVVGFARKPTWIWIFHPVASLGVLFLHAYYAARGTKI